MGREMKARPGESVGEYMARQPADAKATMERLRALIKEEAPLADEAIKWGFPWYGHHGHLCAIMRHEGYVRLQFMRGAELLDPSHLLEGTGKGMRHLKIHSPASLPEEQVRSWLLQAVRQNEPP